MRLLLRGALNARKERVERLECDCGKSRKDAKSVDQTSRTSETTRRLFAEDWDLLQELQSTVATVTAKLREWRKLAAETAENKKVDKADVMLQLGIWEAVREKMGTKTEAKAKIEEQLAAKSAELVQLSAERGELYDELSLANLQHAAGATVSEDLESLAGACDRPSKRTKVTRSCEESSTKPPAAGFLALLT